jgi:undecaprenyl-diphosphatase
MTTLEIIVLALLQGFTEFLPISSSAHLILPSQLLGWTDQGLAFDVAVHLGTLAAVLHYFRRDVGLISCSWFGSFKGQHDQHSRMGWLIILATIPAALFGLLIKDFIEIYARSALVIASTTIIFGLLLWYADVKAKQIKQTDQLTVKDVIIIGLVQAIALIPGTSRSGITMTAGLMLGLTRQAAARFSFLISIPIILLAGGYQSLKLLQSEQAVDWTALGLGTVLSFISAYVCIHFFLKVIEKMGMLPFVIYRLALGMFLLAFVFYFSH